MRYFVPFLSAIKVIKNLIFYPFDNSGEMVPFYLESLMFVMPFPEWDYF